MFLIRMFLIREIRSILNRHDARSAVFTAVYMVNIERPLKILIASDRATFVLITF